MVIIMGDFNAKVGSDPLTGSNAVGLFGLANERGEQLKSSSNTNNMVIAKTWFQLKMVNRLRTWESPDGVARNHIDHIIV